MRVLSIGSTAISIVVACTDFLADIECRGLVDFAFVNHDGVVNIDPVEHDTHGVNSRAVYSIFITESKPFGANQRRRFGYTMVISRLITNS